MKLVKLGLRIRFSLKVLVNRIVQICLSRAPLHNAYSIRKSTNQNPSFPFFPWNKRLLLIDFLIPYMLCKNVSTHIFHIYTEHVQKTGIFRCRRLILLQQCTNCYNWQFSQFIRILVSVIFSRKYAQMIYSSKMYTRIESYGSTFSRLIPCVYKVYKINYNRYATMVVYFRRRRSLFCSASVFYLMLWQAR